MIEILNIFAVVGVIVLFFLSMIAFSYGFKMLNTAREVAKGNHEILKRLREGVGEDPDLADINAGMKIAANLIESNMVDPIRSADDIIIETINYMEEK